MRLVYSPDKVFKQKQDAIAENSGEVLKVPKRLHQMTQALLISLTKTMLMTFTRKR